MKRWALTVLLTTLAAPSAFATVPSAVHLVPSDAALGLADISTVAATPGYIPQFGVAFATGFVAVPFGQWLASAVGNLSVNLIGTAIPALLIMGLLAPALTTAAAWLYGNWRFLGSGHTPFPFLVPWLAATAVHIAALVVGGFLGVSLFPGILFTFAVVDSLLLSGTSVGFMHLLQRKPVTAVTIGNTVPGLSATHFVPLASASF